MTRDTAGPAIERGVAEPDSTTGPVSPTDEPRDARGEGGAATPEMRLQILATEHWSLLASRALAWNESFSRGSMFVSTLSFATVALALAAQVSNFGEGFRLFALVVLPVVLFLGISTRLRLDSSNLHDATCVAGMNRIRHAYLELAPDLEPYFVMGATDDERGVLLTMVNPPGRPMMVAIIAATPFQLDVLNSVLLALIAALLALQVRADGATAAVIAAAGFFIGMLASLWYARSWVAGVTRAYRPRFPAHADVSSRAPQAPG
jgi:hypothetical protein